MQDKGNGTGERCSADEEFYRKRQKLLEEQAEKNRLYCTSCFTTTKGATENPLDAIRSEKNRLYCTSCFTTTKGATENPLDAIRSYCLSNEFLEYCNSLPLIRRLHGEHQGARNVTFHPRQEEDDCELTCRFQASISQSSDDQPIILCFHGTREENIDRILQGGLDASLRKRQAKGPGEYFCQNPMGSLSYSRGCGKMLVFAVIPPPESRYSSIVVVENNNHQLPLGYIQFEQVGRRPPKTQQLFEKRSKKDLSAALYMSNCYALNQAPRYPWSNLLLEDSQIGLRSDVDPELMVQLGFTASVKIKSIVLSKLEGSPDEEHPAVIHLYVNRENLGFENVEDDVTANQTIQIEPKHLEGKEGLPLKRIHFQRVRTLTIYVQQNGGAECTSLGGIKLIGPF